MKVLYGITIALSAFLLFSIEPMAAKALLPALGGSSAVWITALCFFQLALLAGYGYSFFVVDASRARQGLILLHFAVLAVSGASLFSPHAALTGTQRGWSPQLHLLLLLASRVGLPFFALSTTAPLLQAWYARREDRPVPYRLFALSNGSSLAALLAYPALIEPRLSLSTQQGLWRVAFLLFTACAATLTWRMRRANAAVAVRPSIDQTGILAHLPLRSRLLWFALPAVASLQLAAVTAHLTENVAAMPLLWLAPLAVYLLSFVLAFDAPALYRRGLVIRLLAVLLASLGYLLSRTGVSVPIELSILFFLAELLVAAWFLHAELFALRPSDARSSTIFYLHIAAGGAAGTCFVAILSPALFRSNYDLPLSFALTAIMAAAVTWREGWAQRLLWVTGAALACLLLAAIHRDFTRNSIFRARNFYGSLRVKETHTPPEAVTARTLVHGSIQHGMQWFAEPFRRTPMSYYAEDSGVGLALDHCCAPAQPRNIGVIGLGAGTLAAYGRPGDHIRFYEINPLVIGIARNFFTYTRESAATVTIVPGDARLSLAAEPPQHFDVLVIDAFSGDAIPVHLLTREALALYRRHLAPGGVLAFHISNQYLDLAPVLARLADSTSADPEPLAARAIDTPAQSDRGEFTASWVLMTDRPDLFTRPELAQVTQPVFVRPNVPLWTDQYSSLLPILRWSGREPLNRPASVHFVR